MSAKTSTFSTKGLVNWVKVRHTPNCSLVEVNSFAGKAHCPNCKVTFQIVKPKKPSATLGRQKGKF